MVRVPVWSCQESDGDAETVREPRVAPAPRAECHQEANRVEVQVALTAVVAKAADAVVDSDQPTPGNDTHHGSCEL